MRDVSLAWPAERTVKDKMRAAKRERKDVNDIGEDYKESFSRYDNV